MKTAIQQAAEMYQKNGMNLSSELERYIKYGYVFITPDRLLFARSLDSNRGVDYWPDTTLDGDTWFVKLAIGKNCIPWFLQQIPFYKPYVAWGRDLVRHKKDITYYATEKLLRRFSHVHNG